MAAIQSLSSQCFYSSSLLHSSPAKISVKFTISCCSFAPSPVTVVNGNVEKRLPDRNEIRLGLPSKGRMASDTLDLLRVIFVALWVILLIIVLCVSWLMSFSLFLFLKDCQLSVKQVNPRQYVAQIPQVHLLNNLISFCYFRNLLIEMLVWSWHLNYCVVMKGLTSIKLHISQVDHLKFWEIVISLPESCAPKLSLASDCIPASLLDHSQTC